MAKKKSKPKLPSDFKKDLNKRGKQVEVKFGGMVVNAASLSLTNEQLEAILTMVIQADDPEVYILLEKSESIPTEDAVACIVTSFDAENELSEGDFKDKMDAYLASQEISADLRQSIFWAVKCEAAPNNLLRLWLTKDQYGEMDDDTTYIFIGVRERQWSQKNAKGGYDNYPYEEKPEGTCYESHTLKLIEFIE